MVEVAHSRFGRESGDSEKSIYSSVENSARLTLIAGVSGRDSFTIDPAPTRVRGIRDCQSDPKTSDTQCHINLSIPGQARSTLF